MSKKIEYHNFQLRSLDIKELSIYSLANNIQEKREAKSDIDGSLKLGKSEFDQENKNMVAGLRFEINPERDVEIAPFSLNVEIRGFFQFNGAKEEVDIKDIEGWLKVNSIYLLFPYLREQVYSITQRAGFNPTILPLLSIPDTSNKERTKTN